MNTKRHILLATVAIILRLKCLLATPIQPKFTMHDVITKKCPFLAESKTFSEEAVFKTCTDWAKINNTDKLITSTIGDVLCLLYYDNAVSLCTELKKPKKELVEAFTTTLKNDAKTICQNLTLLLPAGDQFHNLSKIITTEKCNKLCYTIEDIPKELCLKAYSLAMLKSQNVTKNETKNSLPLEENTGNIKSTSEKSGGSSPVSNDLDQAAELKVDNNSVSPVVVDHNTEKKGPEESVKTSMKHSGAQPASENVNLSPIKAEEKVDPKNTEVLNKPTVAVADNQEQINEHQVENEPVVENKAAGEKTSAEKKPIQKKTAEVQQNVENKDIEGVPPEDSFQMEEDDTELDEGDPRQELPPAQEKEEGVESIFPSKLKPDTVTNSRDDPTNFKIAEDMDGESSFFSYFTVIICIFIVGYVGYHNRQKLLALLLEGKRDRREHRGRRPNSANYHKLDSNLEEAISSSCTKSTSNIIY